MCCFDGYQINSKNCQIDNLCLLWAFAEYLEIPQNCVGVNDKLPVGNGNYVFNF